MIKLILTRIWSEEAGQAILLILVMALVLVAAYYTTRFLARSMRGARKGANLQLLDQLYLGKDKYVALLQLGDKAYLVGISSQAVTALDKLDREELAQLLEKQEQANPAEQRSGWLARASQLGKDFISAPQRLRQARDRQAAGQQPEADDLDELIKAVRDKSAQIRTDQKDGGRQE